ncbi:Single-stranded nucleic acid binding R3H [Ascosphaera apis ARSEF 7405]|uniref:Single-stranded nucleic acid binding R3H n=1 Tax=Ascosphaera apis ARSEF 7405 TaxID=392613 RepID=A0A166PFI2_9EURO|nr:Single-stranded nucleic acid binding R3H [Ascosphaera apis ARSEF 7405]
MSSADTGGAAASSTQPRTENRRPRHRTRHRKNNENGDVNASATNPAPAAQSQSQEQGQGGSQPQRSQRNPRRHRRPRQPQQSDVAVAAPSGAQESADRVVAEQNQDQSQSQQRQRPEGSRRNRQRKGREQGESHDSRPDGANAASSNNGRNNRRVLAGPGRVFGSGLTQSSQDTSRLPQISAAQDGLRADAPDFVPGHPTHAQPASIDGSVSGKPKSKRTRRGGKGKESREAVAPQQQQQRQQQPAVVYDKSTADDITTRIHEDISHNIYECPVCTSEIGRRTKVWSCTHCWTVFHFGCIRKWASNEGSVVTRPRGEVSGDDTVGARRKQILDRYPAYLLIRVDRLARSLGTDAHIPAIACAMLVHVHHAQLWDRRSHAFVAAMKAQRDVSTLIMKMDGAVGNAQGDEEESQRYNNEEEPDDDDSDEWTGTFACKDICGRFFDCEKCHAPYPCPENPCETRMELTCQCGRIKEQKRCGMSLEKARAGASFIQPRIACDEECARLERNRTLASALNVKIDPTTTTAANSAATASTVPYSDETLDKYLALSSSATLSTLQTYEQKLHDLAHSQTKRSTRFTPARSTFRAFVHSLAADWGFSSESFDPEPHRYVEVYKSLKWLPPAPLSFQEHGPVAIGICGISVAEGIRMRDRERAKERELKRAAAAATAAVKASAEREAINGDGGAGAEEHSGGGGWAQVARKKTGPAGSPFGFSTPTIGATGPSFGNGRFGALVLKSNVAEEVVDDWEQEVDAEETEQKQQGSVEDEKQAETQ